MTEIIDRTCIDPLMNIQYMYKLALGSRNNVTDKNCSKKVI